MEAHLPASFLSFQINKEFDRQNAESGFWGLGRYQVRLSWELNLEFETLKFPLSLLVVCLLPLRVGSLPYFTPPWCCSCGRSAADFVVQKLKPFVLFPFVIQIRVLPWCVSVCLLSSAAI